MRKQRCGALVAVAVVALQLLITGSGADAFAAEFSPGPASSGPVAPSASASAGTTPGARSSTIVAEPTSTVPSLDPTDDASASATPTGSAPASPTAPVVPLAGDPLSVTVPSGPVNMGTGVSGGQLTAALGQVSGSEGPLSYLSAANFTISVALSGAFTTDGGGPGRTIPPEDVRYFSGPATATSNPPYNPPFQLGVVPTAVAAQPSATSAIQLRATPQTAVTTTSTTNLAVGVNPTVTTTFTPTLIVNIPYGIVAGTYTGTVTHSIA